MPFGVNKNLQYVLELALGGYHACVRTSNGNVNCWGSGTQGELGDGSFESHDEASIVVGLGKVVEIEAGLSHSCARLENEEVRCWGLNSNGQLGTGMSGTNSSLPVKVMGL